MNGPPEPSDALTVDDTVRRAKDPLLGTTVAGRFEVRELLGQGGMGAVYLARQPSVGREVALKVLHRHYSHDETLVKRFEREVHLCARLVHPNVVVVHDAGVADGLIFMAMERLQGRTVGQLLEAGPLEPARACRLAAQVCAALAAAHAQGIVHRDIKPSNVMVVETPGAAELVKVLDFGIAAMQDGTRLTQTHGLMGSPNAIAPELIRSPSNVSPRADLYAVGTLLYEMLTAQPPFGADTPNAVFARQASGDVPPLPPAVPPALASLVASLMNAEPSRRPPSAEAVQRALSEPSLLAPPVTAAEPEPVPVRSRWPWVALVAGVLTVVGLGVWSNATPASPEVIAPVPPPPPEAPAQASDKGLAPMEPLPALAPIDDPGVGDTAPVASPTSETPDAGAPRKKPAKRRSDYEP
ncbi:MAG: serine/threonine protein kinase [Myxococcaceae bacterium]|jgi:serine/threonine-protein kinase|nr:serine/threonine protein kinase [Myxococcaceae bacterium]